MVGCSIEEGKQGKEGDVDDGEHEGSGLSSARIC